MIVGKSKVIDKKSNEIRACRYSDIPEDENGWVHDLTHIPIAFDLMFLKLKNSPKIKSGWWDGTKWEGLRLKPEDTVTAWKRNYVIEF
jgi:hypothetical protein